MSFRKSARPLDGLSLDYFRKWADPLKLTDRMDLIVDMTQHRLRGDPNRFINQPSTETEEI